MTPPDAPPPLTVAEAQRIIGRLSSLVGNDSVVVIGGSALSMWHDQLGAGEPSEKLATTDLDLQGDADAVRHAAELLGGNYRLTSFDSRTAQTGAVAFKDSAGTDRVLDFLASPYGLRAADVAARAIPFDVELEGDAQVRVLVMNPIDCLRSRIANSALPGRGTEHSFVQLDTAIELTRAYALSLLDNGESPRAVLKLNEEVFDLALNDNRALDLYLADGVDVAGATLVDDRLPDTFLTQRLPQLQAQLETKRERLGRARVTRQPHRPSR